MLPNTNHPPLQRLSNASPKENQTHVHAINQQQPPPHPRVSLSASLPIILPRRAATPLTPPAQPLEPPPQRLVLPAHARHLALELLHARRLAGAERALRGAVLGAALEFLGARQSCVLPTLRRTMRNVPPLSHVYPRQREQSRHGAGEGMDGMWERTCSVAAHMCPSSPAAHSAWLWLWLWLCASHALSSGPEGECTLTPESGDGLRAGAKSRVGR